MGTKAKPTIIAAVWLCLSAMLTHAQQPVAIKSVSPATPVGFKVAPQVDEVQLAPLPFLEDDIPLQRTPPLETQTEDPKSHHTATARVQSAEARSAGDYSLPELAQEFHNAYNEFRRQNSTGAGTFTPDIRMERDSHSTNNAIKLPIRSLPDEVEENQQNNQQPNQSYLFRTGTSQRIITTRPFTDLSLDDSQPDRLIRDDDPLWWKSQVLCSLNSANHTQPVDTHLLVYMALKNSPRIQAISQNPLIRDLQIIESDAEFDAVGFVKTNYNDRNDPVGNTLVTGGPPFLKDNLWQGDFGVRRKLRTGASVDLNQRLGFQNSNSQFFTPQDQGTATLSLNLNQPLLRGRGKFVNESQILIAQANSGAAWDTFSNELQDELQQIAQAYWRLYYDRSLFLQKKRNVERGQQILTILEGRRELDSLPSQIARARSAVESRRTELANAFRDIRNTETEIRRRIADHDWLAAQQIELLPNEAPSEEPFQLSVEDAVKTSLEHRREIKEAIHRAKAAGIQYDVGENELLPELTLLLGGYVSALNGNSGVLNSWNDQFGNAPGYNAGFNFEMPYGNRAAVSRLSQRKLQLTKIKAEVEQTIQQVIAESQIALRKVDSAIQTRNSARLAIDAARADLQQQSKRWELFGLVEGDFAEGQNPVILLNQVLDAQERLSAAELIYAQAELELKVAEVSLQRAMGTLLIYQNVDIQAGTAGGSPFIDLDLIKLDGESTGLQSGDQ